MTDHRDDDERGELFDDEPPAAPAKRVEGVRILGAEEAQAALDAGAVGRRLGEHETRYGDVPARPDPALRPSARFPLAADDELGAALDGDVEAGPSHETEISLTDDEAVAHETHDGEEVVLPDEDAEVTSPIPLPHWAEPPTGEVPVILPEAARPDEDELEDDDLAALGTSAPRFRTGRDWQDEEGFSGLAELDEHAAPPGALAAEPEDDDEVFEQEVARRRRRIHSRGGPPPGGDDAEPPRRRARTTTAPAPARGAGEAADEVAAAASPDLATRVITGVGVAVLALVCLRLGRAATTFLATVIIVAAALELFQGFRQRGFRPATLLGVLGCAAIVPIAYQRGEFAFPFVIALVTMFTLLWYLFEVVRARPVVNVAVTVFGFAYVGVLGAFAGLLLSFEHGVGLILGVALCAVAYDVAGYFVGSQLGKTRLAPAISPNKTVEGLVGGMAASILVALVIVYQITPWGDLWHAFALGLTVAIAAPLGDLCESMLKRDLGVKDLGTILPGHGGVLDRFDAILFCLPAVYYLARALALS